MKVKPLLPNAVAAAREVIALADVRSPRDIDVRAIAARVGVMVVYGPMSTARGSLVRAGRHAIVHVAEDARGEARGDFTLAHEVGHFHMHAAEDHFAQCESEDDVRARGGATKGTEEERARKAKKRWRGHKAFWIEIEANHFSTELRMPEPLAAPFCAARSPTLDDVSRLTRYFPTSLTSAGLRFTQLAPTPCAWTFSVDGRVKWASESLSFPGSIEKEERVHPESVAAALLGKRAGGGDSPREVPGRAWGGTTPFLEHAINYGPKVGVMSWIVPVV